MLPLLLRHWSLHAVTVSVVASKFKVASAEVLGGAEVKVRAVTGVEAVAGTAITGESDVVPGTMKNQSYVTRMCQQKHPRPDLAPFLSTPRLSPHLLLLH